MLPSKLHGKRLRIDSEFTSKWITFNNTQSNFTPISLITYAVINQTSTNLQEVAVITANVACKTTWKTCWELTSELTSKWVTFNNTQSNFTPISLITFAVLITVRQIYWAVAVILADGACKITWKTVENWRLNLRLNE